MRAPRTQDHPRSSQRGPKLALLLACLLPFVGVLRGRVLYHCLVTGEYLTACCRDIAAPAVAPDVPSCCTDPMEVQDSLPEHVTGGKCDCCDVVFDEGQGGEAAHPSGDPGVSHAKRVPAAVALPAQDLRASGSTACKPRLRAPPKRPRFLLFESFLS